MMALYDDLYGTPATAPVAAKPRPVAPVPMAAPAVAPDPLVAAMQTMKSGGVAPAAIAGAALPQQAGESPRAYDQRMAKAREEADKVAREAMAPAKKRELPAGEIDKISTIDNSLGAQTRLFETFKPEYGGYKVKFAGDVANTMASTFGGDKEAQADWWKSYNANDNIARNALYGASLTPGETKAWEATTADISMTPSIIKKRMEERAALIEAKRKTTLENLGKAYFNVENFQTPSTNFSPAPIAAPPAAALKEGHVTTFKNGQQWTLTNGKPEKVN
jgi:hypothetical protein